MKLENGRPENTEGRLEKEIRVYDCPRQAWRGIPKS